MRSEFRFAKATVTLMAIILLAILMAIDKAKAIQASIPYANPHISPIKPAAFTDIPGALGRVTGSVARAIGWTILFALHPSGVHRLWRLILPAGHSTAVRLAI